jgi:hypothetical protein
MIILASPTTINASGGMSVRGSKVKKYYLLVFQVWFESKQNEFALERGRNTLTQDRFEGGSVFKQSKVAIINDSLHTYQEA